MAVKLKGVWQRKDVEFADEQAMQKARACISNHPWTIANTKSWADDYAAAYGADELAVLKASCAGSKFNMVQSYNQSWCPGGVWVPLDPKPEEVLKEGYEWQVWGTEKRQVPIGTVPAAQPATVIALDDKIRGEISAIVYKAVMDALETLSTKKD